MKVENRPKPRQRKHTSFPKHYRVSYLTMDSFLTCGECQTSAALRHNVATLSYPLPMSGTR
jgi:hypothetical protein